MRVLVDGLEVRVGGRGIDVEVNFFHVLGVVALRIGEAEQALLEVRVLAVPQGQREAQPALAVGHAEQPILAPAVGAGQGVLVRKALPQVAVRRVVLADRGPLALGQVRAPALPILRPPGVLLQAPRLGVRYVVLAHGLSPPRLEGAATSARRPAQCKRLRGEPTPSIVRLAPVTKPASGPAR